MQKRCILNSRHTGSKWFPQIKQSVNIHSEPLLTGQLFLIDASRGHNWATSTTCFVLPLCSCSGFYCPQTACGVLSEAGGKPAGCSSVQQQQCKGKVEGGCKLLAGLSWHFSLWQCISSLQDGSSASHSSLPHNATGVCMSCPLSLFMASSICRCCYVRGKHESVLYTHCPQRY